MAPTAKLTMRLDSGYGLATFQSERLLQRCVAASRGGLEELDQPSTTTYKISESSMTTVLGGAKVCSKEDRGAMRWRLGFQVGLRCRDKGSRQLFGEKLGTKMAWVVQEASQIPSCVLNYVGGSTLGARGRPAQWFGSRSSQAACHSPA